MARVVFDLQDNPDSFWHLDTDINFIDGECTVREEQALALLINERFPKLKECHRRIKKIMVVDDNGNYYESDDFDMYGSLIKKENNEEK